MKHYKLLSAFVIVAIISSCGSQDETKSTTSDIKAIEMPGNTTAPVPVIKADSVSKTPVIQPPTIQSTTTQPPASKTVSSPAIVTKGLNPAHGQPGHRCDIAVGAPLNSAPATASTQTAAPSTIPATQMPIQKPAITPVPATPVIPSTLPLTGGKNPAHGQPGHRCDIAVGAPLNSPKQ